MSSAERATSCRSRCRHVLCSGVWEFQKLNNLLIILVGEAGECHMFLQAMRAKRCRQRLSRTCAFVEGAISREGGARHDIGAPPPPGAHRRASARARCGVRRSCLSSRQHGALC